jgi:hypothetical protein
MRIAKSKLAVGGDGCLEVPNLETVESRSLRVENGGRYSSAHAVPVHNVATRIAPKFEWWDIEPPFFGGERRTCCGSTRVRS